MIIRQLYRGCWNKDHETYSGKERNEGILRGRWTCLAPCRQSRAQNGPHARHTDLHLEGRQSRCREAVAVRRLALRKTPQATLSSRWFLARDLKYISDETYQELRTGYDRVIQMLSRLRSPWETTHDYDHASRA